MFNYDLYLQNQYERYCGDECSEEEDSEIEEEEAEDEDDTEIERAENLIEKMNERKLYGR